MNIVIKESGFHNALFRRVGFSFASFLIKFLYCICGMMCSISNCIMQMSSWGFSLLGVNASLSNFPAYANKQKPSNLGLQYRFMREVGRGGIDEVGWVGVMSQTRSETWPLQQLGLKEIVIIKGKSGIGRMVDIIKWGLRDACE